jgi:hypothetical protein
MPPGGRTSPRRCAWGAVIGAVASAARRHAVRHTVTHGAGYAIIPETGKETDNALWLDQQGPDPGGR